MKQGFDLSVALCLAGYVTIAHSDEVGLVKGGQLTALVRSGRSTRRAGWPLPVSICIRATRRATASRGIS